MQVHVNLVYSLNELSFLQACGQLDSCHPQMKHGNVGWGKGGNVTSAGWQVTLCDPIWYVSSRSCDGMPACKLLYAAFTFNVFNCIGIPVSVFVML